MFLKKVWLLEQKVRPRSFFRLSSIASLTSSPLDVYHPKDLVILGPGSDVKPQPNTWNGGCKKCVSLGGMITWRLSSEVLRVQACMVMFMSLVTVWAATARGWISNHAEEAERNRRWAWQVFWSFKRCPGEAGARREEGGWCKFLRTWLPYRFTGCGCIASMMLLHALHTGMLLYWNILSYSKAYWSWEHSSMIVLLS